MNTSRIAVVAALTALLLTALSLPASAASRDSDGDGMPNWWEADHGLAVYRANAGGDADRDGLANLAEFERRSRPRDEDTDNDGADDGDEVRMRLRVRDADSDDDGRVDGQEDRDHDGIHNEDEDDARESCRADDDDRDRDGIADEDENDFRVRATDADSDDDGVSDGEEDRDRDGIDNEDENDEDDDEDVCDGDRDEDGERDEDDDDLLGTIDSFDAETGVLRLTGLNGVNISVTVGAETEIEFDDDCDGPQAPDEEGSPADLTPGRQVAEIAFDEDTGVASEIELIWT